MRLPAITRLILAVLFCSSQAAACYADGVAIIQKIRGQVYRYEYLGSRRSPVRSSDVGRILYAGEIIECARGSLVRVRMAGSNDPVDLRGPRSWNVPSVAPAAPLSPRRQDQLSTAALAA